MYPLQLKVKLFCHYFVAASKLDEIWQNIAVVLVHSKDAIKVRSNPRHK